MESDRWEHDLFDQPDADLPEFPHRSGSNRHHPDFLGLPHLIFENLHWQITEQSLEELLKMYSPFRIVLRYNHIDRSTGIADVYFKSKEDAEKVQDEFDGKEIQQQIVTVKKQTSYPPKKNHRNPPRKTRATYDSSYTRRDRDRVYRPSLTSPRRSRDTSSLSSRLKPRSKERASRHTYPSTRMDRRHLKENHRIHSLRYRSSEELDREMEEYMNQRK